MFRPLVPRWLARMLAPASNRRSRRRSGAALPPFRPQIEPLGDRVVPAAGLVLSEVLTNPSGNDSPLEYVELVATRDINFAVTPYTVVFADTTSTPGAAGWANGGFRSYAFSINSGTVTRGSVVYVGGSGMAPTGTKLRTLNTATTPGDGFGSPQVPGVLGNGGAEADGVAVFDVPVGAVTPSTVPVDALLFGAAVGPAVSANYKLPVNDRYAGGIANAGSFVAPNPGTNQIITASGVLDPISGTWATGRSWSLGTTTTSGTSTVALLPVVTVAKIADATEGSTAGTFRFTRTGSTSAALTVNVSASGTATAGTDYTAPTTVTFGVGSATVDYTVTATNDSTSEPTETVEFAVAAGIGYVTGSPAATMDLYDNDAQFVALEAATDTGEGTNAGKFQFARIGDLSGSLTANYTVTGTATSGTDYEALSGTVTFLAGEDRAEVLVEAFGDNTADDGETVIATLGTGTGYTVDSLATTATVTIADQALTVSVIQLADGTEGGSNGTFRFTRGGDLTAALAVDYTVSGTATAGTDYTALTGTVTFGIGQHTVDVSVVLVNDTTAEPTETVTVTLDASDDYQLGNDSDTLFVKDNDTTKHIWVSTSSTDWNLASNWSTGSVPTSGSSVYFDGASSMADCTNVGYGLSTLAGLHLVNGYTGTATLANALTVGTFEESSGTLNQPVSGHDLTVTGVMLWTGGTLNAIDSGTAVNVSGALGRIDPPDVGSMATSSTLRIIGDAVVKLLSGSMDIAASDGIFIDAQLDVVTRNVAVSISNSSTQGKLDIASNGKLSINTEMRQHTGECTISLPIQNAGQFTINQGIHFTVRGHINSEGAVGGFEDPTFIQTSGKFSIFTGSFAEFESGFWLKGGGIVVKISPQNLGAIIKGQTLIDPGDRSALYFDGEPYGWITFEGDVEWKSGTYSPRLNGANTGITQRDVWYVSGTLRITGLDCKLEPIIHNAADAESGDSWRVINSNKRIKDDVPDLTPGLVATWRLRKESVGRGDWISVERK
jgi:hypothetical protein